MTTIVTGAANIERSILTASASGRPAISAFLTGGFPHTQSFGELLEAVAAEVEVIEIGVPFTDPMADGVTIQQSSRRALESGVSVAWILQVVSRVQSPTPIVLMSYLNPLIAFGFEQFANRAADAGVSGLIVPDLPCEECPPFRTATEAAGLALIQLVTPVSPPERVKRLCNLSQGFVYAVTTTGVTGGNTEGSSDMLDYLDRVREVSPVPVLAGFGIRDASQVAAVAPHADGVIVGSALIDALSNGEDPIAFLRELRGAAEAESASDASR